MKKLENMEGKVLANGSNGEVLIVKYTNAREVYVKFIGYNEIIKTSLGNISKGNVKNRMKPSILGIGYLGYEIASPTSHFLYSRWFNMLDRCYNPKNKNYNNYGGNGITISEEWLCFSNYVEDVLKMSNWEKLRDDSLNWDIDKDILGSKIYSKENCKIVPKSLNISLAGKEGRNKKIVQYTKAGHYVNEYDSITEAAEKLGTKVANISMCLTGKTKTSCGFIWKFKKEQGV